MRSRLSGLAEHDLAEIAEYINRDNPPAADRFVDRLLEIGMLLASTPDMGFEHGDLPPGVRYWPLGRYVVFYRVTEAEVLILRIVHGARDWSALIQDPNS